MQLHNLPGTNRKKKSVGRGGKRGTYSGRGGKGQTARAGHRIRPAIRDYLKQIPKRRGRHKHSFKSVSRPFVVVNVGDLEHFFPTGSDVTPKALAAHELVMSFGGHLPRVKILGGGGLRKKFTVRGCVISESAKKAIEKAGGRVL